MLKRVALALIFTSSLGWIAYYAYDLFATGNDFSARHVFNTEDGSLLIISRPSEVQLSGIEAFSSSPAQTMAESLNDSLFTIGYFSCKRGHLLLERKDSWTQAHINSLFSGSTVNHTGSSSFRVNEFNGRYEKKRLYLYDQEYPMSGNELPQFVYDTKASASVLTMAENNQIPVVSDVYFKSNGQVHFVTRNDNIKAGRQVQDEQIFGPVVSSKFTTYHFRERDYWMTQDSIFAKSPMASWLLHGFVRIEYKGVPALITDYIDGQDPIWILNEMFQTLDKQKFNIPLTSDFPSDTSFCIKYLADFVVIAPEEEVCDQIIADHKLGNTVSLSGERRRQLWADLPRAVSERYVGPDERVSKAVYNGHTLETHHGATEARAEASNSTLALACNFEIKDFEVLPGRGNVAAMGMNGEIAFFSSGELTWKKSIQDRFTGDLQLIDLHGNGEKYILVSTEDTIYVWDKSGNSPTGFPITLENPATSEVKFYRWRGKSYFLVANNGEITQFNAKGGELRIFKTQVNPKSQISVWASQNRLFAGFHDGAQFEMYDMDRQRKHRVFDLPDGLMPAKVPNQIYHYGLLDGTLCRFDQKGGKMTFEKYPKSSLLTIDQSGAAPVVLIQSVNEVHLINQEGIPFGEIRLPFNEIGAISCNQLPSGKTLVGIVDGLENNVYLYQVDGTSLIPNALEGQKKVRITSEGVQLRITTIVGQFITEYFEQ